MIDVHGDAPGVEPRGAQETNESTGQVSSEVRPATLYARFAQVDSTSDAPWTFVGGATREDVSEAALVAQGFNLGAQTLHLGALPEAEREELRRSLRLKSWQRAKRGLVEREAELLSRCPRLDAPGLDLDAALVRYVVSWPGGEVAADVPVADRQALALGLARQLVAEEQRRGVSLRMAWSGGAGRAGVHLEWAPVADDLAEPDLLQALRLRAVDLAASAGVPTSTTVAEAARVLLLGLGDVLATPLRAGAAPVTALSVVRDTKLKAACLSLRADPGEARAAELLAELRAAVPPVWLDLAPLNKGAEKRGSQFRLLGGLHKGSGERKALVDGSPLVGSPITRELVAPYVAQLAEERAREQARMAARATRPRAPRAPRVVTEQDREAVRSLAAPVPTDARFLSHEGALALGTVACRLGVPAELLEELVAQLSRPDKRASRVRTAGDAYTRTPARDAKGEPSIGWSRLTDDLGDERAEKLRALLEELGDEEDDAEVSVSEPRRLPVVESEERVAYFQRVLTTPGAAGVDRSPTGLGKTYALAATVVRMYATTPEERTPRTVIAFGSHVAADAFLVEMEAAAAREGLALPRVSRVTKQRCMPDLEDREREHREKVYKASAANGWDPIRAACSTCVFSDRDAETGVIACDWRRESPEAWKADVVIGMKAHLALAGFWDERGDDFNRVVIEEDASDVLTVPYTLARDVIVRTINRLVDVPAVVARQAETKAASPVRPQAAQRGGPKPPPRERTEAEKRAALKEGERRTAAALAACEVFRALLPILDAPEGVHVLPDMRAHAPALLGRRRRPAVRDLERVLFNMTRPDKPEHGNPLTNLRNLLPVVEHVAREQEAGREVRVIAGRDDRGAAVLRLDVRRPIPSGRSVLVLDASAHQGLLEADLGRPVEVLDSGVSSAVRVVQLTDSRWSRTHFGLTRQAQEHGDPEEHARRLEKVAQAVAVVARREGVRRAGLVTYKALAPELLKRLGELCPGVVFEALYFGNLRGSNDLAGVELLAVVGTPSPPDHEVRRRALRLGASREELAERPAWHEPRRYGYASPIMREAERTAVGAELVQAVGRGPRGKQVPRGGVWLFSAYDLPADALPWSVIRTTIPAAALDTAADGAWPRLAEVLEGDPEGGRREVARVARVSEKVARRVFRAWRDVWAWEPRQDPAPESPRQDPSRGRRVGRSVGRGSMDSIRSGARRAAHPLPSDLLVRLGVSQRGLARLLGVPRLSLRRWLGGDPAPGPVVAHVQRLLAERESGRAAA